MCGYSAIHDWAMKLPQDVWTRPMVSEYEEIIRRLKAIDDKLGLPDCNANKGDFLQDIHRRLEALEKKIGP